LLVFACDGEVGEILSQLSINNQQLTIWRYPMNRWILTVLAAVGAAAPIGRADSIWERRDPRYAYLCQDNRARNIGDTVTIVIAENTANNEQDQRTLSKTTSATAALAFGASAGGTGGTSSPIFNSSSSRQFNGNSQFSMNRTFNDQLNAVVVDIMPNGNLVVEGYRSRVVAGEERVLRVTGIVRQADIGTANLVASNQVANFRISYLGRGPATRFSNQNYAGRIFNRLWPF
jgi:flagellar L-ring protein precursor FlgH